MQETKPFGLLNINKPAGMPSRKVVDRVQRIVRPAKAGHAGTLDPIATGVLVVCVGRATRLISHVQEHPKTYRARFLLGQRSETDDVTGDVTEVPDARAVSKEEVERLLPRFVGQIEQVPPQFSAVHVGGRRAYELAREGQTVGIRPKSVHVHRIELIGFAWPELQLEIECGSGTYIRSIGRDLGELLGCGAVMSELVRTRIGPYRLEEAVDLDELTPESFPRLLLPAASAVQHLPQYQAQSDELQSIRHGRAIQPRNRGEYRDRQRVAVLSPEGKLACLAECRHRGTTLAPKQVFLGG